jgi:hypothetical protein
MPFVGIWLWSRTGLFVWLLATGFSFLGLMFYTAMARDEAAAS